MDLKQELLAVTANLRQQAPADVMALLDNTTQQLIDSGIAGRALQAGARAPDFALPDARGGVFRSADARAHGPLVVSFYRGLWCPYCNLELRALAAQLPALQARNATLVAISPQTPDNSLSTAEKLELPFAVLSDAGNAVARQFGLVFTLAEELKPLYAAFGIDLQSCNGDTSFELPLPATYVIAADGRIVGADVNADYRQRLEPSTVLSWLDRLSTPA